ncbi:signal peptidase I [Clostridium cylindrosporum]|uniref:Signal peptidase I n=1 Tax=Clostridium cylindrosporum DSM 605 TaxID=1121307 RepID=A0A0J8DBA1_CLOCY|nr:signal peptidase I [Clostridium cylindrosporum]KMT23350.1 signal peptidase I [Clostridium cylindrosporum DSM 605]
MGKILNFLKDFKWLIIFFIVLQIIILVVVPRYVIPFRVNGESMHDTLQNNDFMIGRKYVFDTPDYEDIIVFQAPNKEFYIKRVIGIPGDTISIKNNVVYRNRKAITENYIKKPQETIEVNEVKLPANKYFVMGDNRDNSEDSRYTEVGLVDINKIKSKVYMRLKPSIKFGY